MKILVLTKRQYMNKDLIDDRYGRFYELPNELAQRGHVVKGLCLSYRSRNEGKTLSSEFFKNVVEWHSCNLGRTIILGLYKYIKLVEKTFVSFQPDIILACSDAFQLIIGRRTASKYKVPFIADLYDNFEYYRATKLPGIMRLYKKAVRDAEGVVCISDPLVKYIKEHYEPRGEILKLTNGIPTDHFKSMSKLDCRKALGLPLDAKLIGTAGTIGTTRGSNTLFDAAAELINQDSTIHLVLAGAIEPDTIIPDNVNVHYLGELSYAKIPSLLNALDVGVICNRDSSFGRYCFPQKAYEMLACRLPVVAANVGVMGQLFSDQKECLFEPSNSQNLIMALKKQLDGPTVPNLPVKTWRDLSGDLEEFLLSTYSVK